MTLSPTARREQWDAFREGERNSMFRDGGAPSEGVDKAKWRSGGYVSPAIEAAKLAVGEHVILLHHPPVYLW